MAEELIRRKVTSITRMPVPRGCKRVWWSVDEAHVLLESAPERR